MDELKMLKRAIIREELVAVCGGDHVSALILNQFLYWQIRKKDTIKYLKEEISRCKKSGNSTVELESALDGWIWKKAGELKEEIMVNSSENTVMRRIDDLIKSGLLNQRRNPRHNWDRTYQYRVNLGKLADKLNKLGYSIESVFDGKCRFKKEISTFTGVHSNLHHEDTSLLDEDTNLPGEGAIPEITSSVITGPDYKKLSEKADFNKLVREYDQLYKKESGGQKPTYGGAVFGNMKRLIKNHGVNTVIDVLKKYYGYDFWFTKNGGRTFLKFTKFYDEIVTSKGVKRVVKKDSGTGNFQDDYNMYMEG